jgi:formylglycine-generating enzyme required for sulfatase activity/uncharacterized caspase-like protein
VRIPIFKLFPQYSGCKSENIGGSKGGMRKIALLVGVGEYALELRQLPKAAADLEALRGVLLNPGMGEFDDVQVLLNPQRQAMEEAIEQLFQNRQKDDLLLLYFSGHGIKDDFGKLYLSTPTTRTENGKLVRSTAVAATFLHEQMGESRSERQVIILDSCFSGAIAKGMTIKDDGSVDLQAQLGGKGRAILTAATSTQYAFEGDDFALSIYTHFLVEGMEKGAADLDDDGLISADELHQYVYAKVKETAPAMTPEFYPVREGHRIVLCKSPKDEPQLKYRKEVERRVEQGRFTVPGRRILNRKRLELGLSAEVAGAIEAEVLRPHQEFQQKLKEYEECLVEALAEENPLSQRALIDLKDFQKMLGLRDEDVREIGSQVEFKYLFIDSPGSTSSFTPVEDYISAPPFLLPNLQLKTFSFEVVKIDEHGRETGRKQGQAKSFEEELCVGVRLAMVAIPAGSFTMGSPEDEEGRELEESPQRLVQVPAFFMGRYPITQVQYEAFMGTNLSEFNDGENCPAKQVSWNDAVKFCDRLTQKTGRTYRLPSEAEWEYACRAGTTTPFHFGETIATDLANYRGTDWEYQGKTYPGNYGSGPKGKYREQTTPVGSFAIANAFGLYDMHGNVWEWCADHWHENYQGGPTDGSAWITGGKGAHRVLRGGSWNYPPRFCRSACRDYFDPGNGDYDFGFRVVCEVPKTL